MWEWVDMSGTAIGLVLAVPTIWTWYEVVWGRRRRERRILAEIKAQPGSRPSILIVDLHPTLNIRASVETFRQADPVLREIPEGRVFTVERTKMLTADDMPGLARDIAEQAAAVARNGTDVLHYFHAGPLPPVALVGAQFANLCRVMVYHHNQGGYENWGPLRHRF